jgi:hypothetical protein
MDEFVAAGTTLSVFRQNLAAPRMMLLGLKPGHTRDSTACLSILSFSDVCCLKTLILAQNNQRFPPLYPCCLKPPYKH